MYQPCLLEIYHLFVTNAAVSSHHVRQSFKRQLTLPVANTQPLRIQDLIKNAFLKRYALLDFSSEPSSKIAPVVVGGAVFLGRAIAGGAIGGAASWATTRILNNRFPQSSSGR